MSSKELVPPDPSRCQADVPTGGPSILTEKEPGEDGKRGSMSLCDDCKVEFLEQFGKEYADFQKLDNA